MFLLGPPSVNPFLGPRHLEIFFRRSVLGYRSSPNGRLFPIHRPLFHFLVPTSFFPICWTLVVEYAPLFEVQSFFLNQVAFSLLPTCRSFDSPLSSADGALPRAGSASILPDDLGPSLHFSPAPTSLPFSRFMASGTGLIRFQNRSLLIAVEPSGFL